MRAFCAILFLFVAASCLAQEEDSFKVSKSHRIDLGIKFDTLIQFEEYEFKLYGLIKPAEVWKLEFPGCNVNMNDSVLKIAPYAPAKASSLNIRSKKYGEVYYKTFTIIPKAEFPQMQVPATWIRKSIRDIGWQTSLPNVKNDTVGRESVENRVGSLLFALNPTSINSGKRVLTSYRLSITSNGKTELFYMEGLALNTTLSDKLNRVNVGSMVTIYDVSFQTNSDPPDITVLGPYKFFVSK